MGSSTTDIAKVKAKVKTKINSKWNVTDRKITNSWATKKIAFLFILKKI